MKISNIKENKLIKYYYRKHVKKYKKFFVALFFLSFISNSILLTNPILNGILIDFAINKNFNGVVKILVIILILFVVNAILSMIQTYVKNYLSNSLVRDIKNDTFDKIIHLKVKHLENNTVGKYISFLEGDISAISNFYVDSIISFFSTIVTIIISGTFVFSISVRLSFIGLISLPIMIIINLFFGKQMRTIQTENRKAYDCYASNVQESLSGIKEVKGLGLENIVKNKNKINMEKIFQLNLKSGLLSSIGGLAQMSSSFLMQVGVYAIGSYMIIINSITVGLFTSFNNYLSQFLSSLQKITSLNMALQSVLVSINRCEELIKEDYLEIENSKESHHPLSGKIDVYKLSFSYDNIKYILNNLTLQIKEKELVAIVGANGSGKTTLFNLLMKLYESDNECIYYDDIKIEEIDYSVLRNHITYVQQQPFLFNDTIKNNLLVIDQSITDEAIYNACKKVKLHDTILGFPNGYDTVIGDRGHVLSGGQKQQLAIARGLLRDSRIFLMDEITSNIDGNIEQQITNVIHNLAKEHTVVMIAHRITTLINVPRIIVIDKGEKVAEGSHQDLIHSCEIYKDLFDKYRDV